MGYYSFTLRYDLYESFLINRWNQPLCPFLVVQIFLSHLLNHKLFLNIYTIEISQQNRNNHE